MVTHTLKEYTDIHFTYGDARGKMFRSSKALSGHVSKQAMSKLTFTHPLTLPLLRVDHSPDDLFNLNKTG